MSPVKIAGSQDNSASLAVAYSQKKTSNLAVDLTPRPSKHLIGASLDAPHKFEACLIQSMIEHMLPEHTESAFGSGLSGSAWRSMMAERVADVVAARGGFGIAAQILRNARGPAKQS